jgi:hypothetical protein
MSTKFLKVKIKSLAAEAVIIRLEESRQRDKSVGGLWWKLNYHRRIDVRREARCALLAYGYLRGRTLEQIEGKGAFSEPLSAALPRWQRVEALVRKYGPPGSVEGLTAWREPPKQRRVEHAPAVGDVITLTIADGLSAPTVHSVSY